MEDSPEYATWVQFRIDTLNTFMADLAATARGVKPDLEVFLTYMADIRIPGAAGKAPEYQAQDLDSMQTAVQPQGVIFETAWQDWLQPDLAPDYVLDYTEAYVPALHDGVAGLGQPDIGSVVTRDFDWVKDFSGYCATGGFSGYAIYERRAAHHCPATQLLHDTADVVDSTRREGNSLRGQQRHEFGHLLGPTKPIHRDE